MPFSIRQQPARRFLLSASIAILLAASGCKTNAKPSSAEEDAAAVRKLDSEWSRAARAHDLEKTLSFYADDAYMLAPNEPLTNDRAAVRKSWVALLEVVERFPGSH